MPDFAVIHYHTRAEAEEGAQAFALLGCTVCMFKRYYLPEDIKSTQDKMWTLMLRG